MRKARGGAWKDDWRRVVCLASGHGVLLPGGLQLLLMLGGLRVVCHLDGVERLVWGKGS